MKLRRLTSLLAVASAAMFTACTGNKFTVEGEITNAKDSVLYLEQMMLESAPVKLDSAVLSEDGSFSFKAEAPVATDFYRLRIADQIINIAIDSTETVTVKADYQRMASGYSVEGSEECSKIRELALKQQELTRRAIAISEAPDLNVYASRDSVLAIVKQYKEEVMRDYIYKTPQSAAAYFALFQALGQSLIFDPSNREDNKAFAAVATCWDQYHAGSIRTENLHNIAVEGMKNVRIVENDNAPLEIDADKVSTAGYIDVPLPDNNGKIRHISELSGKVVLLDFHIFQTEESTTRIMALRNLYNKFHDRGFDIYQVSLDPDEHFWKTSTARLPWISVRDKNSLNSPYLNTYNIQNLPDFFIIDRGGNIVKRADQVDDIEAEIAKLL